MAQMGSYCKAYPVARLRQFVGWKIDATKARAEAGPEVCDGAVHARTLNDEDYLYIQENYTVTDGVFIDENVVFANVTDEWIKYCRDQLSFEVPEYVSVDDTAPGQD